MLEHEYDEPGIIRKEKDDKESKVDIYVSAESLRVYDNPWVETESPNIPEPEQAQHPVSVVSGNSGKRNHFRASSLFLGTVCLLLLIGIICLAVVVVKKDKFPWDRERNQLLGDNAGLRRTTDQLRANITKLRKEKNALRKKFCRLCPKKCKNLDKVSLVK